MGTEVKHPLSSPPGEIWAGVMPSRSIAPAVSVALEAWQGGRVGHGHTRNIPLGIPPWVNTALPKGRSWKLSVCSCCSWDQPRGRGAAVLGAHTEFSVFPLLSGEENFI